MISVHEATQAVFSNLYTPRDESLKLNVANGRILAEEIFADRDLPPFDRVTMDGIAIDFQQWKNGQRSFQIEAIQAAGEARKKLTSSANAMEVMTGAVVPDGADTVIRYEDLEIKDRVATILSDVQRRQSIHWQGQDARSGSSLLSPGQKLSAAEIALLASVGKSVTKVFEFPRTAIVGSGDELVSIDDKPKSHQVRRSNVYAIEAAMGEMGWHAQLFHLADDEHVLNQALHAILNTHEVVILSGGVSKGKFDFIPSVLESLGVTKIFHQVKQRPGKPFWFGRSSSGKTVFALPGNPVSTFMCFYRYIKPWMLKSLGVAIPSQSAMLARDFSFEPALTYFLQVGVKFEDGKVMAYPDQGGGSGDFANLKKVDGFLELPAERTAFNAGEAFPFIPFRL